MLHKWTDRGVPMPRPVYSPDHNPFDFYLCSHLKSIVYTKTTDNSGIIYQYFKNYVSKYSILLRIWRA